jgi:hypothetical protein
MPRELRTDRPASPEQHGEFRERTPIARESH